MVHIKFQVLKMRGYTLIELMVTVTIIVLITGGSMAAYLTFNESRQLDIDARAFTTLINKIRSKAIFLEYPSGCTGLNFFSLQSKDNSEGERKIISYFANCNSGSTDPVEEEVLGSSVFTGAFTINFLPLSGNISDGESVEVTIRSLKGEVRTKKITIDPFNNTNNSISDEN